jgi:hypothetical protein
MQQLRGRRHLRRGSKPAAHAASSQACNEAESRETGKAESVAEIKGGPPGSKESQQPTLLPAKPVGMLSAEEQDKQATRECRKSESHTVVENAAHLQGRSQQPTLPQAMPVGMLSTEKQNKQATTECRKSESQAVVETALAPPGSKSAAHAASNQACSE